jgi:hypothetical protein
MKKGRLTADITNTVLEMTIRIGYKDDIVMIHEDNGSHYMVSKESNPSSTFYVNANQVEIIE